MKEELWKRLFDALMAAVISDTKKYFEVDVSDIPDIYISQILAAIQQQNFKYTEFYERDDILSAYLDIESDLKIIRVHFKRKYLKGV